MTDELVKRLLNAPANDLGTENLCLEAAARIAALTAEAAKMLSEADYKYNRKTNNMIQRHAEQVQSLIAERDRLREALWAILACETPNANATVTRMASISKAALKGDSHD